MSTLRNYSAAAQIPNQAGFGPFQISTRADMLAASVLPNIFPCPLAVETIVQNMRVTTPLNPVPLVLAVPSKSIIEGKRFEVTVSGRVLRGITNGTTAQLRVYLGGSMTISQNVLLLATGTGFVTSNAPFELRIQLIADTASGILVGSQSSIVGPFFVAEADLPTIPFVVNFRNNPVLRFLVSALMSPASPLNFLRIDEFAVNF